MSEGFDEWAPDVDDGEGVEGSTGDDGEKEESRGEGAEPADFDVLSDAGAVKAKLFEVGKAKLEEILKKKGAKFIRYAKVKE